MVLTDYLHMSGFKLQGQILMKLIYVVQNEVSQAPIKIEQGTPGGSNIENVQ